jgi:putative transposase
MKRKRFTEEQIIGILREHEAGAKAGDLARKHGVSEATLYNWKAKYGGMDVSDAKRLKALEDENTKLKKLLADQMLEASALRELLSKKMVGPAAKREAVAHLQAVMGLSERRACSFVGADRKMIRYQSSRPLETEAAPAASCASRMTGGLDGRAVDPCSTKSACGRVGTSTCST